MSGSGAGGEPPQDVIFHYIKSGPFRVVHVDGAIGTVTPRGLIHAAVYSERMAIPRAMTYPINADGELGPISNVDARPGVVREVEVSLMLDRAAATAFRDWLTERLADLDKAVQAGAIAPGPQ